MVRAAPARSVEVELKSLRTSVDALTVQLGLCLEAITVMRADQLRLLQEGPGIHRCTDPHHRPARTRARKA